MLGCQIPFDPLIVLICIASYYIKGPNLFNFPVLMQLCQRVCSPLSFGEEAVVETMRTIWENWNMGIILWQYQNREVGKEWALRYSEVAVYMVIAANLLYEKHWRCSAISTLHQRCTNIQIWGPWTINNCVQNKISACTVWPLRSNAVPAQIPSST